MEQLTLQHLAPYLPYSLNGLIKGEDSPQKLLGTYNTDECTLIICHSTFDYECSLDEFKPILRPLKEIQDIPEIQEEFSEYHWESFVNSFFLLGRSLNCFDHVSYTIVELCFKYHLDIFGLIDKGLAIDANTIQQ
jgi:hypothetical protein